LIDARILRHAATRLDDAAVFAHWASNEPLPRVVGRRAALERINERFTHAVDTGRGALADLQGLGGPIDELVAGVRETLDLIDPRTVSNLAGARLRSPHAEAARQVRAGADQLRELASLEEARGVIRGLQETMDAGLPIDVRRLAQLQHHPHLLAEAGITSDVLRRQTRLALSGAGDTSPEFLKHHILRARADLASDLAGVPEDVARARLQAQLDEIVAQPLEDMTFAQRSQVGVIAGMPEQLRPTLPRPLFASHPDAGHPLELLATYSRHLDPATDRMAFGEYELLRLAMERRRAMADPQVTRATLDAEVRRILALGDDQITPALNARMSMIAGLPDELRPAILDVRMPGWKYQLSEMSAYQWLPGKGDVPRSQYAALRVALEHEGMLANPAVTRAAVGDELMRLLAKADDQLTHAELRRISVLARLPDELRPSMPPVLDEVHRFEDIGILGQHPREHVQAARALDQGRVHVAANVDPESLGRQLKAQVDAGELIDIRIVDVLGNDPELLARAGLTPDVLHRQAVRALSGAGTGSTDTLLIHLQRVHDDIAAMRPADDATRALRDQAVELADQNLARMRGERRDTYSRHPDYAEVGRIASIAKLLGALKPAAADAVETLSW
jgi:hypothetical protein